MLNKLDRKYHVKSTYRIIGLLTRLSVNTELFVLRVIGIKVSIS